MSENYAIQSREDEAEALSGAASERLRLELVKTDTFTSRDKQLAKFHENASHLRVDTVDKLLPSDIDLWFNVIHKLSLPPSVTSSSILQSILQLNLASPDDALRMRPYATHLKVAAFARMQKR